MFSNCQDVKTDLAFDFHTEKMRWVRLSRLPEGMQLVIAVGLYPDALAVAATRYPGPPIRPGGRHTPYPVTDQLHGKVVAAGSLFS